MQGIREDGREEMRKEFIRRLIARSHKMSLNSMRAEDMAKHMEISKVTMYKYFTSKDEILSLVIFHFTNYLRHEAGLSTSGSETILVRYQKSFEQSLMINFYFSEHFVNDFKQYNPRLYEEIADAQQFRSEELASFYRLGAEQAIFHPVNPAIFILDDELVLRRILNLSFLVQCGLKLDKALHDYYEMQKRKLIRQEYLETMDNSPIDELIRVFVAKNSRYL